MSTFYKLSYAVGFHPWEDLADHQPFADALLALVEREEQGRTPPYGKALDLGCGSATWGVRLAARGWQVTGVDNVARALRRAEERIREAGVEMRLVHGDVTRLRESGVGSGYDLVLDTGTFHGLTPAQRLAMGREVDAIAAPDSHRDPRLLLRPAARSAAAGVHAGRRRSRRFRAGRSPTSSTPTPTPTRSRGPSSSTRCSTRAARSA